MQGEGNTTGVPAYFIRLSTCNLTCGASAKELNVFKKTEQYPDKNKQWHGELHKQGKATWTCDSIPVWLKGKDTEFQEIIDSWKEQGIYDDICKGIIHIIWTGGEPTIPQHQESIVNFLQYFREDYNKQEKKDLYEYNEIETNGTFVLSQRMFNNLDQINCSVKLSNSGMLPQQRIRPDAIKRIMEHPNYWFKFVISNEEDIKEIFKDFIEPFNIPLNKVMCMPGLDDQKDYFERTNFVCEMAKKYKFIAGTRMHIASWNSVTGV